MRLSQEMKIRLAESVEAQLAAVFPEVDPDGACMYRSLLGSVLAREMYGLDLRVSAGSCYWTRLKHIGGGKFEGDDGVMPHRFGYEFEWTPLTVRRLAEDSMPEMHVWLIQRSSMELVDLSAGRFPAQCLKIQGYDWPNKKPPKFWWDCPSKLPYAVEYRPDQLACTVASELIRKTVEMMR